MLPGGSCRSRGIDLLNGWVHLVPQEEGCCYPSFTVSATHSHALSPSLQHIAANDALLLFSSIFGSLRHPQDGSVVRPQACPPCLPHGRVWPPPLPRPPPSPLPVVMGVPTSRLFHSGQFYPISFVRLAQWAHIMEFLETLARCSLMARQRRL